VRPDRDGVRVGDQIRPPGRSRNADREPVAVENHVRRQQPERRLHLEGLSREDWILAGVATALILDLLVLPWFSFGATISVGSGTISIGGSAAGVDSPDAWLGVLALLSCAFLVADLGFERLSPQTRLPTIAEDRESTRFVLAWVAAGLIAVKFIFHLGRFGELALGFWLAVLLVGALVALTRRARQVHPGAGPAAAPPEPRPEPGPTA